MSSGTNPSLAVHSPTNRMASRSRVSFISPLSTTSKSGFGLFFVMETDGWLGGQLHGIQQRCWGVLNSHAAIGAGDIGLVSDAKNGKEPAFLMHLGNEPALFRAGNAMTYEKYVNCV